MKNIAIVGAHRDTKLRAPYGDPSWEIWSCSQSNENELPRVDVWFELHRREAVAGNGPYLDFLKALPKVYMQTQDPEIPGSVPYPLEAMLGRFGPHFFKWTPCYMLAWAINLKPEEIGIWGIGANAVDYGDQKICLQHFIQMGKREGIHMTYPPCLDEPAPLYGYDR